MEDEINIKMSRRVANNLLLVVEQVITDAEDDLNTLNPDNKLLICVWKNGLNFWNNIKDAIIRAQEQK